MLKKILPWFVFASLFILIIVGYRLKDNMDAHLSTMIKNQAPALDKAWAQVVVDSLYNYSENELNYQITFLEFGAKGCSACKRMETVMEEIKHKYPDEVNVIFRNVLIEDNLRLMKYYGIASIPTQVILDDTGKEFFRHSGYISTADLNEAFQDKLK
ncbi:thioredoxin family protein [Carboxylicivirga sp. N1Y90]|uniref:thioredoxin family protein n=1 Tax=Carboxylicivirga fragile TaxID=3417571 RepID=UPI003D338CEB|nr:thioredoxin family protein [Marinilabiliaceae bacterium N1Y90]